MAEVVFNYEGIDTTIQCNLDDKMKDIINKFLVKINGNENNLCFLYNGNRINKELTFNEQANDLDKNRKKMNIIITKIDEDINEKNEIISKDIICPECKENILMNIENFKLNFSGCNKNHTKEVILYKYKETQKINLNDIICNICNNNNKGNTHNNEFYYCNNCNKNICPLCKSIHDKNHIIINYDDKNYICNKHNDSFSAYCKDCKENLCVICENEHEDHNISILRKMLINKNDLLKINENLKNVIDKFTYKIKIIKEIFDKMVNILNEYYKINESIINNYNINKRNYHQLQNLYNLKNNNEKIIKDLNNIINNDKISEIYEYSFNNFYNENGDKYIGEIKNGLKNGKGILYYDKNDEKKRLKYERNILF